MGGDPIPGPFDPLVKWFEEWKATLPRVKIRTVILLNRIEEMPVVT